MIDVRCITGCLPGEDCVLVVAPKYCICMEDAGGAVDAGGFRQPPPTDLEDAARRNPDPITGRSRIRPGGYTGENDTLGGGLRREGVDQPGDGREPGRRDQPGRTDKDAKDDDRKDGRQGRPSTRETEPA